MLTAYFTKAPAMRRVFALAAVFVFTMMFVSYAQPQTENSAMTTSTSSATAVLAGGCFWCIEHDLEKLEGVSEVVSGYSGGHVENPEYKDVARGTTGHREVVQVTYNPDVLSYADLLRAFFRNIDPTDAGGQFCDRGFQYSSAIYVANGDEQRIADEVKAEVAAQLGQPVATAIEPAAPFYMAEDYHQDYADKNPLRYRFYRGSCGRDAKIKSVWSVEK